ncbi:glycosyl hydrolase family 28-related protein [Streptomyces sanglieri]|uniref:Glycosyl hydrolase family 28-related protein n=1 Tax=Streptomyces sanglieri TaxID=193460 RepID=A0ABW2XB40_9ACTN
MKPLRPWRLPTTGILAVAVVAALLGPLPAGPARAAAETVVKVTAFGADPTGRSDSAAAVAKAVRHAKTVKGPVRIVFPHGTYQIYPEQAEVRELYVSNTVGADQTYKDKRIGILLEDMNAVTVDGDGSHLQFHGLMTTFAAIRSHDVTVKNFSFDFTAPKAVDAAVSDSGVSDGRAYRVLTVPQGSGFSAAEGHVTWLGEKSPATGQPYWSGVDGMQYTQIHDPAARRTWRGRNPLFDDVASMTDLGHQKLRIDYTTQTAPTDRGLVYQMRQTTRDTLRPLLGVTGHHRSGPQGPLPARLRLRGAAQREHHPRRQRVPDGTGIRSNHGRVRGLRPDVGGQGQCEDHRQRVRRRTRRCDQHPRHIP